MNNTSTTGESGNPTTDGSINASGFITNRNVCDRTGLVPVDVSFISNRLMNKTKQITTSELMQPKIYVPLENHVN